MAFQNPNFRDEGVHPGLAARWTLETHVQQEGVASFGPPPLRGHENFERWTRARRGFEAGELALAMFDPQAKGLEGFGEGWLGDVFLRELPDASLSMAFFDGEITECWVLPEYVRGWSEVVYETLPAEVFEGGLVRCRIEDVVANGASFDNQGQTVERFEIVWWTVNSQ